MGERPGRCPRLSACGCSEWRASSKLRNLERIAGHGSGPLVGALTIDVGSGADVHDGSRPVGSPQSATPGAQPETPTPGGTPFPR